MCTGRNTKETLWSLLLSKLDIISHILVSVRHLASWEVETSKSLTHFVQLEYLL